MSSDISALIHDPTELLCLLYSKYGDINEDFNYLYLNQIFFNKLSHYCTAFKEQQYTSSSSEYLKREYHLDESLERLPQLSEYYRTYHLFFCRPFFRNWHATKLLHKYGDKQAELFYKNNLASSRSQLDKLTSRITNSNSDGSSLSSLDNQTQVGVIFNQRVRKIINNDNKDNVTITLNTEHTQVKNNSNCLITHRSRNNSFVNFIQDVVKDKPPVNVQQQQQQHQHNNNPFLRGMCNNIKISSSRHNNVKSSKMKRSLCALTKNKNEQGSNGGCSGNGSGHNNSNSNNKILLSPKMMQYQPNFKSNIVEFNHNKPKQSLNIHSNINKNKTSFHNNSNYTHNNHHHNHHQQKLSKLSYSNVTNKNSIMIMTIPTNNNGGHTTTNLNINLNFNLSSSNNTNNNTNTHTSSSNNNNNNKVVQFNHHYRHHSKYSLTKVNRISLSKHKNTNKHKKHRTLISDSSALNSGGNNTHTNNNGNTLLHPSSSIPRYSSSSKGKRSNKHPKKQPSFPTTINNINTSSNTNTNVNTNNNNNNNNNEHFPYSNILMSLQFQTNKRIKAVNSQRSLSNNNNSIKTPTTTNRKAHFSPNNSHINNNNNNHTCLHSLNKAPPPSVNDRLFISRNQKQLQKISVQTIRSSKRKKLHKSNEHNNNNYNCGNCNGNNKQKEMKNKSKTITTKSVDDKKTKNKKHKNMLSELTNFNWYNNIPNSHYNNNNNNVHKHTTNQKMINQLEELIKRAKCSTNKKTHSTNQTSMNNNNNNIKQTNTNNNNDNNNIHKRKHHHSKSNVKNSYILEPSSYGTSRGHSSKQTQSIVNSHFRLKSSERKSMRVFSPKL